MFLLIRPGLLSGLSSSASPQYRQASVEAGTTRGGGVRRCRLQGTGLLLTFPDVVPLPALEVVALPPALGVVAFPPASAAVRWSSQFLLGAEVGGERPLLAWARGPSQALASRSSGKPAPPAAVAARNCCSTSVPPRLSFPFSRKSRDQVKGPSSILMSASEMMPTSRSPSTTKMRSSWCSAIS